MAIEKGFQDHNLIAVERDGKSIHALRSKKVLAINGDIVDVLFFWEGLRVNVLFADFCCGYTPEINIFVKKLLPYNTFFTDCIVVLNLMRGRENWQDGNDFLRGHRRSTIAYSQYVDSVVGFLAKAKNLTFPSPEETPQWADEIARWFKAWCQPWATSYRSNSGQVFDSIIWRNLCALRWAKDQESAEKIYQEMYGSKEQTNGRDFDKAVKLSAAAIKANRTMRMQAA